VNDLENLALCGRGCGVEWDFVKLGLVDSGGRRRRQGEDERKELCGWKYR